MTRSVLILQHMETDSPGRFSALFRAAGWKATTVKPFAGESIPSLDEHDLMFVLGGAMDVWEEDQHPWLKAEKQAIREWAGEKAKPYIGICLGHQLLADALGGEVGMSRAAEVGAFPIALDEEASTHAFFSSIAPSHTVLEWHHAEVKRLPEGARALASSEITPIQAMAVDDHALGVQFHFEWTLDGIQRWAEMPGWLGPLEKELGQGAHPRFMGEATRHMPGIAHLAETLFGNFSRKTGLAK
ncbi:MAG: type 1 glutamine amidotransferase [Parvibaculaceae bacterium]